jgi:hypothetical protein
MVMSLAGNASITSRSRAADQEGGRCVLMAKAKGKGSSGGTGAAAASAAGKVLRSPKSSKAEKKAAASDLAQRKPKKSK